MTPVRSPADGRMNHQLRPTFLPARQDRWKGYVVFRGLRFAGSLEATSAVGMAVTFMTMYYGAAAAALFRKITYSLIRTRSIGLAALSSTAAPRAEFPVGVCIAARSASIVPLAP
ncbi:MAG: hypothetical protein EA425_15350 [Puniceicoccaceae bacterium]|nr:MAG: hypothetical protein EA425_15350 [Puniceicoccaceae bacterium]